MLEFFLKMLGEDHAKNRLSVRYVDNCFILRLNQLYQPRCNQDVNEHLRRIGRSVISAVNMTVEYDYLRYCEEISSELIKHKFIEKNPITEYMDLVNYYSYAPEIQKFIREIFGCLQKAFEKEAKNG